MIEWIAIALRDDGVFKLYLAAMMAVMIGPMVVLTIYYHANVSKTEGGRKLMRKHARLAPDATRPGRAIANLGAAGKMARNIAAGRYGESTRRLQNRTYLLVGLWVLANVVMWAIPMVSMSLYPDPLNPPGLRPATSQR